MGITGVVNLKSRRLVYGAGINDYEGVVRVDGRPIPSYVAWTSMLNRCYSAREHIKSPTYKGCSVCEEWLYFTQFKHWYDLNYIQGWQLDKDLLVLGSKQYSPKTCTYIPSQLNTLFNNCGARRGDYPQGVSWYKRDGKFQAQISINKKSKHLGWFASSQQASNAYQSARNEYVLTEIKRYRELYSDNKPLMILLNAMEART